MRYMMLMIPQVYQSGSGPALPDAGAVAEMQKYNDSLTKAGVLLALDGLTPPQDGSRVSFGAGGKPTVTDGPFTEAREIIGGFWLIQAKSQEEAVEWARRCPAGEGDVIEIRRIFDPADFEPEATA